jgi:hypothetical protein
MVVRGSRKAINGQCHLYYDGIEAERRNRELQNEGRKKQAKSKQTKQGSRICSRLPQSFSWSLLRVSRSGADMVVERGVIS